MFIAYSNALDIVRALKPIVDVLRRHDAELAKQLQRAGTSMVLNIAEGSERDGRDPKRFYTMAHGSAKEILACLDLTDVWGWPVDVSAARELLDRELALLWRLTHPARPGRRHA